MEDISPEWESIIQCTSLLIESIMENPGVIAAALYEKQLLSKTEYQNEVFVTGIDSTPQSKAQRIVAAVENKIKVDSCLFRELLLVFDEQDGVLIKQCAEKLSQCYQKNLRRTKSIVALVSKERAGFVCPHCKRCSFDTFFTVGCPQVRSGETSIEPFALSYPFLDTKHFSRKDEHLLYKKLKEGFGKVTNAFLNFCKSLSKSKKLNSMVDEIKASLSFLPIFNESEKEKLTCSTTVLQILTIICTKHVSFYNYELVELIIHDFGSEDDKTALEEYLKEFRLYCSRNVFEVPSSVLHPPQLESSDPRFALKYSIEGSIDLNQVKSVCILVADILGINSWDLYILSIEKGCILLRIALLEAVAWKVLPITPYQEVALKEKSLSLRTDPSVSKGDNASVKYVHAPSLRKEMCNVDMEAALASKEATGSTSENQRKASSTNYFWQEGHLLGPPLRIKSLEPHNNQEEQELPIGNTNIDFNDETGDSGWGSAGASVQEWLGNSKSVVSDNASVKHVHAPSLRKEMCNADMEAALASREATGSISENQGKDSLTNYVGQKGHSLVPPLQIKSLKPHNNQEEQEQSIGDTNIDFNDETGDSGWGSAGASAQEWLGNSKSVVKIKILSQKDHSWPSSHQSEDHYGLIERQPLEEPYTPLNVHEMDMRGGYTSPSAVMNQYGQRVTSRIWPTSPNQPLETKPHSSTVELSPAFFDRITKENKEFRVENFLLKQRLNGMQREIKYLHEQKLTDLEAAMKEKSLQTDHYQEAELKKAHAIITCLNDKMAESIKINATQAEQISKLEAENERLIKQRKRMLGQGVLEEMEKKSVHTDRILKSLSQQLKHTEALLKQHHSKCRPSCDSTLLKQHKVPTGYVLQEMFVDHKYSRETGTYWRVAKPVVDDILCEARQPAQFNASSKSQTYKKFVRECILMSQLNHPNIVKFMGVHFGRDKFELTLLSELPSFDLTTFLTNTIGLPSPVQYAILHDISSGLSYLHNECFIIHRNLTAMNISLTADRKAQIGNFECACFLNDLSKSESDSVNIENAYKAPEISTEKPEYSTSADIFSMGVLSLFVATQESPELEQSENPEHATTDNFSETLKRKKWIDMINKRQPELSPIVELCLSDNPADRPSTSYLKIVIEGLKTE